MQRATGGDGLVTLGEIRADGPMLTITASNADFTHEITVNDTNEPVSPTDKVSMNLGGAAEPGDVHGRTEDWNPHDRGLEHAGHRTGAQRSHD